MIYLETYRHNGLNGTFTRLDTIESFTKLEWFLSKNGVSGIGVAMDALDQKATIANFLTHANLLVVKEDGVIQHAGWITERTVDNGMLISRAVDVLGRLHRYYTTAEQLYTQVDAGQIALDLINQKQALEGGNLGIVSGTISPTVNRDRTYRYTNVGEAIVNLSNVIGGFDFAFAPTSANEQLTGFTFSVAQEIGNVRNELPTLVEGENITNISTRVRNRINNSIVGLGDGFGDLVPTRLASSSGSISGFGRYEHIAKFAGVTVDSTLEEYTNQELIEGANEELYVEFDFIPNSNIDPNSVQLGDTLNLDTRSDVALNNITGSAQVVELAYTVDQQGQKYCSPKVKYYR
jgi:hypothetical protein